MQLTAHSNAYVERLIGSIRRECLDHVIVLSVAELRRVLADYVEYYMNTRTQPSLGKDAPASRPAMPLSAGRILEIPQVQGLHLTKTRVKRRDIDGSPEESCGSFKGSANRDTLASTMDKPKLLTAK